MLTCKILRRTVNSITPQNPSCCRICHAVNSFTSVTQAVKVHWRWTWMSPYKQSHLKSHIICIQWHFPSQLSCWPFPCPTFTILCNLFVNLGTGKNRWLKANHSLAKKKKKKRYPAAEANVLRPTTFWFCALWDHRDLLIFLLDHIFNLQDYSQSERLS